MQIISILIQTPSATNDVNNVLRHAIQHSTNKQSKVSNDGVGDQNSNSFFGEEIM